ncbi:UvrABC system protein B OS=Lysinibacillus sphaericus OX=1421 GN=uvrB PE=3 SV=1 [Lysinibacillus sphaericus]
MYQQRLVHMNLKHTPEMVQQIIRPTGLLVQLIDVRPIEGQIDDLIDEIHDRIARNLNVWCVTYSDEKNVGKILSAYVERKWA